jgi:hypothetical protein
MDVCCDVMEKIMFLLTNHQGFTCYYDYTVLSLIYWHYISDSTLNLYPIMIIHAHKHAF